jgi:hypothetical protein
MSEAIINAVAVEKLQATEALVKTLAAAEGQLELGYAKLANALAEISEQRYWQGSFESFGQYVEHISDTYKLGKSQIYKYLSAARDLGDSDTEDQLNTMGISKALCLREAKNSTGQIPESALSAALDSKVSVKDMKRLLYESKVLVKPEDGTWADLDFSCYVTEEERAEISDARKAAMRTDPPVSEALPEHMQKKETLLRFAREFLAAYPTGE